MLHEGTRGTVPIPVPSERSFGAVMAAALTVVAIWPLTGNGEVRLWAVGAALAMLVLGFALPRALRPLNILWFKFGLLLHRVTTPLVMGGLFFLAVTPTALVRRALGHDVLRLKRRARADSYWIQRTPPGPDPESMKRQF